MRGSDAYNEILFSTIRLEDFVPPEHPLRSIRQWVNDALAQMDARFSAMYEADLKGNRHGLVVNAHASPASSTDERDSAARMLEDAGRDRRPITVVAD